MKFSSNLRYLNLKTLPKTLTNGYVACSMNLVYRHHAHLIKTGLDLNLLSLRKLLRITALSPGGNLTYARSIFDRITAPDTFAWNTMIRGYTNADSPAEAISLFVQMRRENFSGDHFTFPLIFGACSRLSLPELGKEVQAYTIKIGLDFDIFVMNTLLHMYGSCGLVECACQVFNEMPQRDLVSWSSAIGCLVNNGLENDALILFQSMQISGIRPDEVTMVSLISAISSLGALELGKWVHCFIDKNGLNLTVSLGTALIVMYSKCGYVEGAVNVFDKMPERNVFTWTALINGFAIHGLSSEALEIFSRMKKAGIRPDYVTFIGVLSACSHGGLLQKGRQVFDSLKKEFHIEPGPEHYGCMVDLLGRAGLLDEAYEFIKRMPIEPGSIVWRTLLGACVNHGNVKLAELVKGRILDLDPNHEGDYVLLSNVYGGAGRWAEKAGVRSLMKERGIEKNPGFSCVEVNWVVHEFVAGDESYPNCKEINEMVGLIIERLKLVGYSPDMSNVLFDIEEEEKEHALSYHSEKLAVAFALLSIGNERTVRVVKNLRICQDCHCFMKFVSMTFKREVIVRDRNRFHHFRKGSCSCHDYW